MKSSRINLPLTVISTIVVAAIAILVIIDPVGSTNVTNTLFNWILTNLGAIILAGTFIAVVFVMYLMLSKYGRLHLGKEGPSFSKFKIFNMIFCSSFGASALYWCFTEVMFYYNSSMLGIEANSAMAGEYALSYNLFHWGIPAWTLYAICALPFIYSFYIKGRRDFSLSAACNTIYDGKVGKGGRTAVDVIFIFACIGLSSVSLGLAVPLISECLSALTGWQPGITMSIGILVVITVIFTASAALGLEKGISRLSDFNVYIFIALLVYLFLVGNPIFTLDYITDGLGLMAANFVRMSFSTDPIAQGGFPQVWTVFYWAYWLLFGPGMGVFIARVCKGQTLKDTLIITLVAGPAGCWLMHGITQSYVMNAELKGTINAAEMIANGQDNQLIIEVFKSTPIPMVAIAAFTIVAITFMATTMDSNAFTLASVSSKIDKADNPPQTFRIFWCVISAALPIALISINAELNTIKTIALILCVPLGILFAVVNVKMFKRMKKEFGGMTKEELSDYYPPEEEQL